MKNLKQLASLLLALVMVFALATTAFAADGDYTITIENSVTYETYSAYRVFRATYEDDKVAYKIYERDPWYALVSAENSPFELQSTQATADGGRALYVVRQKTSVTDADLIAWFNSVTPLEDTGDYPSGNHVFTGTGDGGALTLNVEAAGYYFIKSNTGAAVTLTTAHPNATVIDKTQTPGNNLTKTVKETTDGEGKESVNVHIDEDLYYTITSNIPAYDGADKVVSYTFTDTMGEGLTLKTETVSAEILKADGTVFATLGDSEMTASAQGFVLTYTIPENYPSDAAIKITYTAHVNDKGHHENKNTVTQTWTTNKGTDPEDSTTDEATVYLYGFTLKKTDEDGNDLTGAKFVLRPEDGSVIYFAETTTEDGGKIYTVHTRATGVDTTGYVSLIEVGEATIVGLDADITYYLKEKVAPAGYNLLEDEIEIRVGQLDADGDALYDKDGINNKVTTVQNNAGSLLPSTGGMGTTLFYVLGGVLVLAAIVLLVTKKRMSTTE